MLDNLRSKNMSKQAKVGAMSQAFENTPGKRRAAQRGLSEALKQAPDLTPGQVTLRANALKRKAEETAAAEANSATLARRAANAKPEPKAVLKVGSGSAIGVASGAMDGQPHTKRAVEEARIAERANAKAAGLIEARTSMGQIVYVKRGDPLCRQVDGTLVRFPDAATVAKFDKLLKQWLDHKAGLTEWPRGMGPTPKKTKPAAAPKAKPTPPVRTAPVAVDRAYAKGERKNESKPGSWTEYMIRVAQGNKSTFAGNAAHAATGEYAEKKMDWKWMNDKGYIKLK